MQIGSFGSIKYVEGILYIKKGKNKNYKKATKKEEEEVLRRVFNKKDKGGLLWI